MQNDNIDILTLLVEREKKIYFSLLYLDKRIENLDRYFKHREFLKKCGRREVIMRYVNKTSLALTGGLLCGTLAAYVAQSSNLGITGAECVGLGLAIPLLLKVNPKTISNFKEEYAAASYPDEWSEYLEKERIHMFAKQFKDKLLGLFKELHELGRATEEDVLLFEEKSKKYSVEYLESFLRLVGKHAASSEPYYPRFVDGTLNDYLIEEGYTEEVANDFLIFMESYHGSREENIELSKK